MRTLRVVTALCAAGLLVFGHRALSSQEPATAPDPLEMKVDVAFEGQSAREALISLLSKSKVDYILLLPPGVGGDIRFSAKNIPLEGALVGVVRSVRKPLMSYQLQGETLVVSPRNRGDLGSCLVWANFTKSNLRYALGGLLRAQHTNYVLEQSVNGEATVKMEGLTQEAAMNRLLGSSGKQFQVKHENGVVSIRPAP